jgi:hypothetical protein
MNAPVAEERWHAYWDAMQTHVCALCIDQADDGRCGLTRRRCALATYLPVLVTAILSVRSDRMREYTAAIAGQVCSHCAAQDRQGQCVLRDAARCALRAYLPLVVDAVRRCTGPSAVPHEPGDSRVLAWSAR